MILRRCSEVHRLVLDFDGSWKKFGQMMDKIADDLYGRSLHTNGGMGPP